jgi:hypothetical protein
MLVCGPAKGVFNMSSLSEAVDSSTNSLPPGNNKEEPPRRRRIAPRAAQSAYRVMQHHRGTHAPAASNHITKSRRLLDHEAIASHRCWPDSMLV